MKTHNINLILDLIEEKPILEKFDMIILNYELPKSWIYAMEKANRVVVCDGASKQLYVVFK